MMNDYSSNIVFMTIIAVKKLRDTLPEAIHASGGLLINTVYGRGTMKPGYLMEMLGLMSEEKKVVIQCIVSSEKVDAIFEMLKNKFYFDKPNTGVAFTVLVDKLSL